MIHSALVQMQRFALPIHARAVMVAAIALLLSACALQQPAESPAVIHENAHSGGSVVSFNHGGNLLASGGWEGTVRLWQMPGGAQLRHWRDHSDSVNGIIFMGDDSEVVSAGYDGLLVRRSVSGSLLATVDAGSPVTHMAADHLTDRLLTGHADGMVRLWRASVFTLLADRRLHRGAVKAVAVETAAMRYASSGADGKVFVWRDIEDVHAMQSPPVDAWTLAFSPDGRWLSGGGWFRLFRWNLQDASLAVLSTPHHGIIKSVEYLADGDVLATISRQTDSSVYFLDPASGALLRSFQQHDLCGGDISVSADGRYLATTSDDASVRIWLLQPAAGTDR
jgi:WD40 repeat protein